MNYLIIVLPVLVSFLITVFLLPNWINRAKGAGLVGKDIHKHKAEVAEAGGVTVIAGFALGVLIFVGLNTFLLKSTDYFIEIFSLMTVILLMGFIAFTDDILGWKIGLRRRTRLFLVLFSSIPLIAINAGKSTVGLPFFGQVDLGLAYPLFIIPLGIIGATTTYNFLAGFNGLESGQGIIILTALTIVAAFTGNFWLVAITLCMVSSLIAFLIFNFCPARVFPGDSLTYTVGGLIAIVSILGNFEKIAVFFFIPYVMETLLKSRGKLIKESFGELKADGSLGLRYDKLYSLCHVSIYVMEKLGIKATERKVVVSIWIFQVIIILLGFVIFRGGIFGGS